MKKYWPIISVLLTTAILSLTYLVVMAQEEDPYPNKIYMPTILCENSTTPPETCGYRQPEMGSNPDEGIQIQPSWVVGPAILQLSGEDSIIAVYPEVRYWTPYPAIGWLYTGDSACLELQFQYFPGKEVIKIQE